jgi:hypothetical protein
MKFPAEKGDQLRFAAAAPNTGKLASQEPRMKKQSIENQHMHAMTPHWDRVISESCALYDSLMGEGERVAGADEMLEGPFSGLVASTTTTEASVTDCNSNMVCG